VKLSRERLLQESEATGFRPEVLEKVIHLLTLLTGFNQHPLLRERVALKGGTALNLFILDLPRLSVDIDLNYVGAVDVATMQADPIENEIEQAFHPGAFIPDGACFSFVSGLEAVAARIDEIAQTDAARATALYETFLAGCYETAVQLLARISSEMKVDSANGRPKRTTRARRK
jgi:hypothetical protein